MFATPCRDLRRVGEKGRIHDKSLNCPVQLHLRLRDRVGVAIYVYLIRTFQYVSAELRSAENFLSKIAQ